MAALPTPTAQIPELLQESLAIYSRRVRELAGSRVRTIALFGTRLPGGPNPLRAARNVVVFERIDLDLLRQLAAEGARFGRLGIAAPLVLTPEFLDDSLDTFPLELLEIECEHTMLWGEDCFAGLTFQTDHVRLQCERELKVLLVGMHQGLLAAGGREQMLSSLGTNLADELLRIVRGVLWLRGDRQPRGAFQMIEALERLLGCPLPGFLGALDDADTAGWNKFRNLYADVEVLGQYVDAM